MQPSSVRIAPSRKDVPRNSSTVPLTSTKGPTNIALQKNAVLTQDSGVPATPAIDRNVQTTRSAHKQPTTRRKPAAIFIPALPPRRDPGVSKHARKSRILGD